jgi:hypothetical protein
VFAIPAGSGFPFVAASARVRRPFHRRPFIAFIGPDRLNRRALLQHPTDRSAYSTSLEVCFPSACAGRVAPSAATSRRTIPLRRSRPPRGPPEVGATARRIFVLAVLSPCVLRAPGPRRAMKSTIHTGPVRVIAPRSLFRAAFRYPIHQTLSRLGRTCWCICAVRQRSWDFSCPSQCSLAAGPRISAVHPHMPFRASPSHAHPLIFTGGRSRISNSFPGWVGFSDATGPCDARRRPASGSCCRRQAERARLHGRIATMQRSTSVYARARQSCHGLLWSSLGRVGCRFSGTSLCARARHRARSTTAIRRSLTFRGLPSARGF